MFKLWKFARHLIIKYSPFVEIHRTRSYKMQFIIDTIVIVAQPFVEWSLGSGISPPFHTQDMRAASKLGYSTAIAFISDHFYVRFSSEGWFDISVGSQYRMLTCVSYIWCPFFDKFWSYNMLTLLTKFRRMQVHVKLQGISHFMQCTDPGAKTFIGQVFQFRIHLFLLANRHSCA